MKNAGLVITAALALTAVAAFAALDVYDSVTVKTLRTPGPAAGTQTNAAVDVAAAKGICNFIATVGPGHGDVTNYSATVTLTHCATSSGTYAIVTNGAGSAVSVTASAAATGVGTGIVSSVKVEAEVLERYLQTVTVVANDTNTIGAVLLYSK
jgi:hypothetical protein